MTPRYILTESPNEYEPDVSDKSDKATVIEGALKVFLQKDLASVLASTLKFGVLICAASRTKTRSCAYASAGDIAVNKSGNNDCWN